MTFRLVAMYPLNIYSMEGKGREMMHVRRYMERGKVWRERGG
jgi:hypothetical protein